MLTGSRRGIHVCEKYLPHLETSRRVSRWSEGARRHIAPRVAGHIYVCQSKLPVVSLRGSLRPVAGIRHRPALLAFGVTTFLVQTAGWLVANAVAGPLIGTVVTISVIVATLPLYAAIYAPVSTPPTGGRATLRATGVTVAVGAATALGWFVVTTGGHRPPAPDGVGLGRGQLLTHMNEPSPVCSCPLLTSSHETSSASRMRAMGPLRVRSSIFS
jgi:hypothetical protein